MENTQDLGYGWLYVVTHPNGRGLIKIGITDRPEARMNDLGNPEILARIPVKNPRKHESDLHCLYQSQRLPQSEWFNLSNDQTEELLRNVAEIARRFLSIVILPEWLAQPGSQEDDAPKDELTLLRSQNAKLKESLAKKSTLLLGANLSKANLNRCKLLGVDLRGACLCKVNFMGADLSGSDLRESDMEGSDFTGANLRNVNFNGADLRGARLWHSNLSGIIWDKHTKWPTPLEFIGAAMSDSLRQAVGCA